MNATVNFAQTIKKATCSMTTTQYSSNNSLTPEFKWTFLKKEIIWTKSLTHRSRLKKDLGSKFCLGSKVRTYLTGTIQNPRQKLQLIHDPQCFQNQQIRSIYCTNSQSMPFLRPNPSIRKPIHPLRKIIQKIGINKN